MSKNLLKNEIPDVLRSTSFDTGFHFYTENGVYTGITATSLYDFMAKLQTVDIKSILFDYLRGDFQKWIEGTLGDKN